MRSNLDPQKAAFDVQIRALVAAAKRLDMNRDELITHIREVAP